jgi:K+-sensing histidine kinase KdpD
LIEDLRKRIASAHPEAAATVQWDVSLGEEELEVDPQLLLEAFSELLENALSHDRGKGTLLCRVAVDEAAFTFALREPKSVPPGPTENWGAEPLAKPRSGHYALGLFRARGIFQAHDGTMQATYDPAEAVLNIVVTLPRARA